MSYTLSVVKKKFTKTIKQQHNAQTRQKNNNFLQASVSIYLILSFLSICIVVADRMQYHQQGLRDAPSHVSYRFGYDSGDRENPQSRHEVSYEPGYVTGAYSFVDANNKLQVNNSAKKGRFCKIANF